MLERRRNDKRHRCLTFRPSIQVAIKLELSYPNVRPRARIPARSHYSNEACHRGEIGRKASVLTKLAWLGNLEGLNEVSTLEGCDLIRRTTESCILSSQQDPSGCQWLSYLSNAYFSAYMQLFASIGMRPIAQALAKLKNLVIIDRCSRAINEAERSLSGGTNILGCTGMKALRLTNVARRRL